jgi:putative DNA primase/helicase
LTALDNDPFADEMARLGTADLEPESPRQSSPIKWPHGFMLNDKGLWFDPGEDKPAVRLSGPFTVLGLARDPNGDGWSIAVEWQDRDHVQHHHFVPLADLIGDGTEVLKPLVAGGLEIHPHSDRLKKFKAALAGLNCGSRVRLVRRSGWHGDVFVLPHATVGQAAGESVVYDGKADAARYGEKGTLADWVEKVAKPSAGNSRLVLSLSTAFAGPLTDLLNDEGGGVHLVGGSSLGKSTALVVAGSVWGGGGRGGFTQTWRATGNALEAIARAHSGTLLALDELGELDAKEAGSTAYLLVNGQGKARATRDAEVRTRSEWRIMLLSSGEIGLGDKIAETGKRAKAGQLIRLVDVPADAGKGFGLFEDTKGHDPAEFSKEIKAAALRTYGTAGQSFVEYLADDPEATAEAAHQRIADIQRTLLEGIGETSGQASRVAHRFALIATAGEFARVALGLPWAEGEAVRAAAVCFDAWRGTLGGEGPGELVSAVEAIKAAVEKHGESRFRKVYDDGLPATDHAPIRDLLGYRLSREGEVLWGFTSTGWKEVLAGIAEAKGIARMMAERGALMASKNDKANRLHQRVDGRTVPVYAVKASALEQWGGL